MLMRYHKGLGIGHVYTSLKEDNVILLPNNTTLDYEELMPEPPIIIVDDEMPDTLDELDEAPSSIDEGDDSGEGSDNQDLFESGANPNDDIDDPDWLNDGSNDDDSLELEYDDMYGGLIDEEYED